MPVDFLEPGAPAAAPLRRAAMLLHSMGETDRRWMLARVEPAQRDRLQALLAELAALDFPADAELVREALGSPAEPAVPGVTRPSGIDGWSADEAWQLLQGESADAIALLLGAGDWAWAAALRARLGAARCQAVEASRYADPAVLSTALVDAVTAAAIARHAALKGIAAPASSTARRAS